MEQGTANINELAKITDEELKQFAISEKEIREKAKYTPSQIAEGIKRLANLAITGKED